MNKARLIVAAIYLFATIAVFAQLGTVYGVTTLVAPILAWLCIEVYYTHLDLFAAECDLSKMIREMLTGQASRLRKREERRDDASYITQNTIMAQMAPAARYQRSGKVGFDSEGRYNQLVLDGNGGVQQAPYREERSEFHQRTPPSIQVVVESAPDVNFNESGMWLIQQNEGDRKRSSRRKKSTRLNSVLFMMLYYSGPVAVKRAIIAELRGAHERSSEAPEINSHLAAIAGAPTTVKELLRDPDRWDDEGRTCAGVWLAMRLYMHPRRRLWIKLENGQVLRGWSALEYLETL